MEFAELAGLCSALGLAGRTPVRYSAGSVPVYALGDAVLKLYPPGDLLEHRVEAGVLAAVAGRLPIPTPRLLDVGRWHGWGYVLMHRLDGTPLDEVWDGLGPAARDGIANELGEALAVLHSLPFPVIDDWWPVDWEPFVATQREGCVARQASRGLPSSWLAQIPPFLASVDLPATAPVLLHTEVMREHLFVSGGRLSGLLDFEPAMRGGAEYEFVAPGVYTDRRFLDRLLAAYGQDRDAGFPRRLLAWTLLHVYGNFARYLGRMPAVTTLEEAADRWFG